MQNYILIKFEDGDVYKYPVEQDRLIAEKDRVERIINSERNGINQIQLGHKVVKMNTRIIGYEVIEE